MSVYGPEDPNAARHLPNLVPIGEVQVEHGTIPSYSSVTIITVFTQLPSIQLQWLVLMQHLSMMLRKAIVTISSTSGLVLCLFTFTSISLLVSQAEKAVRQRRQHQNAGEFFGEGM